jgi:hypothetical protein
LQSASACGRGSFVSYLTSGLGALIPFVPQSPAVEDSRHGGGIYSASGAGPLTVTDSTLSGNSATGGLGVGSGGGIYNFAGPLTVTGSTLSANVASGGTNASGQGGGIYNAAGAGPLTVTGSTLSGNSASGSGGGSGFGGGIYHASGAGRLTVTGSTLSGNSATSSFGGGGIFGPVAALRNTIVAGNTASPASPDVSGPLGSQGHNLVGIGDGGSGFTDTDLVGTSAFPIDPMLEPLGDYGGPTQTMRPLPGSPVINLGDNTDAPTTDQRGFPRIVLSFIDIGAVELQPDEFGGPNGFPATQSTSTGPTIVAALTHGRPVFSTVNAPATDTKGATLGPDRDEVSAARTYLDALFGLLGGGQGHGRPSQPGPFRLRRDVGQPTASDGEQIGFLDRSLPT